MMSLMGSLPKNTYLIIRMREASMYNQKEVQVSTHVRRK